MAKDTTQLSMTFHPLKDDSNCIDLPDFINNVKSFINVTSKFKCNDNLKIVSLSSNSPIKMIVEGKEDLSVIYSGLSQFVNSKEIPQAWNRDKIDAILQFLKPIGTSIAHLDIVAHKNNKKEEKLVVNSKSLSLFKNCIKSDYSAAGTIDGMLEAVNIHNPKKTLTIYPTIGKNKIVCTFDDKHLNKVKKFIGCYVEIDGEMKYQWRDRYPYKCTVNNIEVVKEDNLPDFSTLYGMAPNATHGVPAEDFIAKVRSQWANR